MDKEKLITQSKIGYYMVMDRQKSREHGFWIGTDISKYVKEFYVGGRISVEYYNFKSALDAKARGVGLLKFNPYIKAGREKWNVEVGFEVAARSTPLAKDTSCPTSAHRPTCIKPT